MLPAIRYFVIIFAILTQAVLSVLGIGNILAQLPASIYTTVNACVAVSGLVSAVFMTIVIILEVLQREQTTTNALFEIIWVGLIWVSTTLEASWLSTADVMGCDVPYTTKPGTWDICLSHRVGVPLAWAAAFFATAQLVIAIMLVEWHRAKAPSITLPQSFSPRSRIQRIWTNFVKPEVNALAPILRKSVYVLIRERSDPRMQTRRFYDRRQTFMNRVSRAFQNPSTDKTQDDRIKLRWEEEEQNVGEAWTGSYYFQNTDARAPEAPVNAPLPVFAPTVRLADLPRFQLHDAPVPRIPSPELLNTPVLQPRVLNSNHSRTPSTSSQLRPQRGYVRSHSNSPDPFRNLPPASPQLSVSPSSPRFPTRSRTLPSLATPPRARLHGSASPAPGGPLLTRSATVGARRFEIPSRYKDLDWTVPQEVRASFAAPLPPPGFLPRPNARY
ncbi:hypothetical protein M407DRAFT_93831 [Tulasnella calospora MUT 4182]|uniref:Uncharacterized protein n=1 Tax=Tulasnella calospora MUT 4182 TaxID=1051891 RepID=A0A0C3QHE6_9AGAM|nr:hypothetical protein M407DRAFT_93831 [Tulasnella calospora MUT 4182]